MNSITIKENRIAGATAGERFYAHTDKGIIYGSSPEIVKRKAERLKAKPYVLPKTLSKNKNIDDELPY